MATGVISSRRNNAGIAEVAGALAAAFSPFLASLLLFASGIAALVYEVLWTRQLTLVVGVDVFAITTAISGFFTGLAIGSWLLGRVADRATRPVRLYAVLELGGGILGLGATIVLSHAEIPFAQIESRVGFFAWLFPVILVALPAFLMGGTLPALLRACLPNQINVPQTGGVLYAANTAGGIAGALLTSFVLIPQFGIRGTALAAVVINGLAATAALLLEKAAVPRSSSVPDGSSVPRKSSVRGGAKALRKTARAAPDKKPRLALILYAVAGGIALGYEVVWSQAIVPFLSTRVFAFSIVLATYLTGLALGSVLYAHFEKKVVDPWSLFGILIAGAGLVALVQIGVLGKWLIVLQTQLEFIVLSATHNPLAGMCARFAVAAIGVVFVPTLLLGAAFPAVLRLSAGEGHSGRDVGAVVALNTAGGIAGTMLTGFLLIPGIGLVSTLVVLAIGAAAIGVLAVLQSADAKWLQWGSVLVISAGCGLAAIAIPSDHLAKMLVAARGGGELVAYEESSGGTVAVVQERGGNGAFRRLYIQGVSNSGDALPSLRYMRLQALLPLIIHRGEPKSALVVGLGTGITAGGLLAYTPLEQRVAAELLPAVVHAAAKFHGNFGAASNSELKIRLRDGRRELVQSDQTYDLITLEPPPPSAASVTNLYSTDFYRLAAKRLRPNGLLAQWLPIAAQNDDDSRSLVRSFLDIFPYATAWTTEMHEVLLVGSLSPIELDAKRIATRFNRGEVAAALGEVGIGSPEELLATWLMDRSGLERYAGKALPVTDDRPRIEYAAWVRPDEIVRVLPELLSLRSEPPLIGANKESLATIQESRVRLLNFYAAGLAAYSRDRETWATYMQRVFNVKDENPYYLWAIGRSGRVAGSEE